MKTPAVYILASKPCGTLYVGVTSDLNQRMAKHVQGLFGCSAEPAPEGMWPEPRPRRG
jgi:putative endonuclease